jgi:hypothetical protein
MVKAAICFDAFEGIKRRSKCRCYSIGNGATEMLNESRLALSVVAPCFNEAAGLPEFYRRVCEVCYSVVGDSYEVLLVDDGSRDATWPIMCDIARLDHNVVAIRLSRNHGHQLALTAGLRHCTGERVLNNRCRSAGPAGTPSCDDEDNGDGARLTSRISCVFKVGAFLR